MGTATIILLINKITEMAVLYIPMEVIMSIPGATTCGKIAAVILSIENHKPAATIMVVAVAAEAAMEDAVIMSMETITAKVEKIKAKAKLTNRCWMQVLDG